MVLLICINNNLLDYTEFAAAFQSLSLTFLKKMPITTSAYIPCVKTVRPGAREITFAKEGVLRYSIGLSAPIAQLEECQFPKLEVTGSIPVGCASFDGRAVPCYAALPDWFSGRLKADFLR